MKRLTLLSLFVLCMLSSYPQAKGIEKIQIKAENGDAKAQYRIGWYYKNGAKGFNSDCSKALEWLKKSAENNYAPAEYYLGWCYYYGSCVEKDVAQARYWYEKAAIHGYKQAKEMLKVCDVDCNKNSIN